MVKSKAVFSPIHESSNDGNSPISHDTSGNQPAQEHLDNVELHVEGAVKNPLHDNSVAVHQPAHGDAVGHAAGGAHDHHEPVAPTKMPKWLCDMLEPIFKMQKRKTTIELEVYTGVVQFISCLYVLPVVPYQMKRVGYDETASIIATCITCAIGSIIAAFLTDMPFIIAPPTSVSIFLAVSMQQTNMMPAEGNCAVIFSGIALTIVGAIPPISRFVTKLIPNCIQASTSVGIGLITALAGATEIHLVVKGECIVVSYIHRTSHCLLTIPSHSIPSPSTLLSSREIHHRGHGRDYRGSGHRHRFANHRRSNAPLPRQGRILLGADLRHNSVVDGGAPRCAESPGGQARGGDGYLPEQREDRAADIQLALPLYPGAQRAQSRHGRSGGSHEEVGGDSSCR